MKSKEFIYSVGNQTNADIVITEIGGTAGDIESQPFMESDPASLIRGWSAELPFIHVTLVPLS